MTYSYDRRTAAKADFYTPATFKRVVESFKESLEKATGFAWKAGTISKSNRKTIEGVENALIAKFYPSGQERMTAEVGASMVTTPTRVRYVATMVVERFQPVVEEVRDFTSFADMASWLTSYTLNIPS